MKKILSILLSAMLILSTMTVLMLLPAVATTAKEPVNLIVNGDASMGNWSEQGYESVLDTTDPNYGFIVAGNAYGWRAAGFGANGPYANAAIWWYNTSVVFKDVFTGHTTGYPSLRANKWNQSMQDIKIEAGKTYKVSADLTFMPVENTANYTGSFDIAIANLGGKFVDGSTVKWTEVKGKDYDLCDANDAVYNSLYVDTSVEGFPTAVGTDGKTYWNFGDFKTYSFTFDSDDVIADYALTADSDNKYTVTVGIQNNSSLVLAIDNVSVYEVVNVTAEAGGVVNTDAVYTGTVNTLTAKPYYGNTFAGWYDEDGLVSTAATYTGVIDSDITAKFNVYNQVVDGNFEVNNGEGAAFFNKQYTAGNGGKNTVAAVPAGSSGIHGSYALYSAPATNATTNCDLINVPVTLKKNTDYVFHISYYSVDTAYPAYLSVHADNGNFTNAWTASAKLASYTYHWEKEGTTNLGGWTVEGTQSVSSLVRKQTHATVNGGANTWIDTWLVFNSGEDASIFDATSDTAEAWIAFGVANSVANTYYVDNVSFAEAASTAPGKLSVVAGANGSVTYNETAAYTPEAAKFAETNGAKQGAAVSNDQLVANGTRYAQIVTNTGSYTASPAEGFGFAGWYDADDTLVSKNATETFYTEGTYTAKFNPVPYASEGGILVENNDDTVTAKAYYGNTFDGWYDGEEKLTGGEYDTDTIAIEGNYGVVAKFTVNNLVANGNFDYDLDPLYYTGKGSGEIKTEADGNRYVQVTTSGNDFTAARIPFTLEQGKKYVISYKWRESVDENGASLSTAGTSFRKNLRYIDASNGSPWAALVFTSSKIWKSATKNNAMKQENLENGQDYAPLGAGTYLNLAEPGESADCWQRYSHDVKDWIYESILVDTTSLSYGETVLLANEGDTVKLGIMFGNNNANTQVIDIDDIVVGEYVARNFATHTDGGRPYVENPLTINGIQSTYNAIPLPDTLYEFDGWYDEDGALVSKEQSFVMTEAGNHMLKASFIIPKVDVNEEGSGDFEGDLDPSQVADKNNDTILEMVDYTEDQKALAGYDAATMGNSALKVTAASNEAHLDVSFPVEVTAGGKYLGHLKLLVESSAANDPTNESAALADASRFDAQFGSKAGSWSTVANALGTISMSNTLGKVHSEVAKESLYISHWFGAENEDRFNNDFVDVYYYIDAANIENGTYYLSLGLRNGGVFYVDNVTFIDINEMAPTMVGATMNTNVEDGDEIMYVTHVDLPSYVAISKVATYMAPTTKLANAHPERVQNFADDLGEEYVATATLEGRARVNMITDDDVPFRNGDLYSAFVGASKVTQTNKYSARSVITLTDASGNNLGITLATQNTVADSKIENGVYTRSINQVKRLNAKNAIDNGYAELAAQMITEIPGKALFNGAIAQVWEFVKAAFAAN